MRADKASAAPGAPRTITVPDFRGQRVSETWYPAMRARVRTRVVRLTDRPAPTDGLVIDQDPPPGTEVRRDSVVTLSVLHPDAD
jgi:beta-lactam-binding protein with PASTA domain